MVRNGSPSSNVVDRSSPKALPRMPHRTSPKVAKRSTAENGHGGSGGRSHSGQSTLPPSPSNG